MKKILALCVGVLVIGAGWLLWRHMQPEHYGIAFKGAPLTSIAQIVSRQVEGDVQVEGKIVRQCPVSGCWFYLDDGKGHRFRIEFGTVLPKLPQKIGRTAIVEGSMVKSAEEPTLAGAAVEFK